MLKDRFFYPLAALIAVAMVVVALSFSENLELTEAEIRTSGYETVSYTHLTLPTKA